MTILEFALNEIDRRIEEQRDQVRDCERVIAKLQTQRQQLVDDQRVAITFSLLPKNGQ